MQSTLIHVIEICYYCMGYRSSICVVLQEDKFLTNVLSNNELCFDFVERKTMKPYNRVFHAAWWVNVYGRFKSTYRSIYFVLLKPYSYIIVFILFYIFKVSNTGWLEKGNSRHGDVLLIVRNLGHCIEWARSFHFCCCKWKLERKWIWALTYELRVVVDCDT